MLLSPARLFRFFVLTTIRVENAKESMPVQHVSKFRRTFAEPLKHLGRTPGIRLSPGKEPW